MNRKKIKLFTVLLTAISLAGCSMYTINPGGDDFYYLNPEKDISNTGRAIMVSLQNRTDYPAISPEISEILYRAIQKKQLFGLDIVRRTDPKWINLQLDLDKSYTAEELMKIRKELKTDAILIGSITQYEPFPHMNIGLRLKLIDLDDGQLIWAAEQVWDSSDQTTKYRIKRYYKKTKRLGMLEKSLREKLFSVSSKEFLNFVSYEIAKTMVKNP